MEQLDIRSEKLSANAESFLKFREQYQLLVKDVGLFVDSHTVVKILNCLRQISGFL
jgi:hypothetical protein